MGNLFQAALECSSLILPHSVTVGLFFFPIPEEEGVYKAGKKRSEMRGAVEVQEDEDTQTEVPLDQVSCKL